MPALVECVPNFSEGRDKARVDAIIEAMKMDGVYLLDPSRTRGVFYCPETEPRAQGCDLPSSENRPVALS